MNVFKELVHSLYDYKCYGMFLKNRKRKTFLYAILLILLYCFFTIGGPVIRFQVKTGGIIHLLNLYVPDFKLEDGRLAVADIIEYEDSDFYVLINTMSESLNETEIIQKLHSHTTAIIMNSNQIVLQSINGMKKFRYRDLDPTMLLTKKLLLDIVRPTLNGIMSIVLLLTFLFKAASFFLGALIVALICMIVASCMKYNLTFGEVYKLAIYTRTLPLLIKAALSFLSIGIPMFFIINIGISICIFREAIRAMKEQWLKDRPLKFYSEGMETDK